MNEYITSDELSVDNCEREPIHIPGHIQPFGTLLAGDAGLGSVSYAAANLANYLSTGAEDALGKSFATLLPEDVLHDTRNILAYPTASSQRERVGSYTINGRVFEIYAHLNPDKLAIVELEEVFPRERSGERAPVEQTRLYLAQAAAQKDLARFLQICTVGLRQLTGFDRVKGYRYAADGSGEVLAESVEHGVPSFFGLRYPASDVPAQARALQIRNPMRIISDTKQVPVDILSRETGAPLDLSMAHLRGVSPIHIEYMQNMDVGASLTIGLVVDGKLWGMFACHHRTPKVVESDERIAAELFGQMVSLLIKERQENEQILARSTAANARERVVMETDAATDLLHAFPEVADILRDLIPCDGLAVLREDRVQTVGSVPSSAAIHAIGDFARDEENLLEGTSQLTEAGWHLSRENAETPDLGNTAGCLIVRSTAAFPLQLMFFRDEIVTKVKWAGSKEKTYGEGPYGPRLNPRSSFETFVEEQTGHSEPWTGFDVAAAREIQVMLTQITAKAERNEMTRHKDLVSHQRQQELMIAELNHRVKNILALIRSLSRQAKDSSASLESYAHALEQRISALASAHDMAVSESMRGVSLRGILETELSPYLGSDSAQALLSGPVVGLRADVAPMIALVFHEVVSNAAKYGALCVKEGVVQARWDVTEKGLEFSWRELGGPTVKEPTRYGFGRSLIEKAIPYEFDGQAKLEYDPSGLKFDFFIPAETLVDMESDPKPQLATKVSEIKRVASGTKALLVEDNIVLAMDMVDSISRLGAEAIETAATVPAGLDLLRTHTFDFAVLDMNLRGEVVFDLAQKLAADGTPFIFVTGYGSKIDVPPELREIPILTKPVDDSTLSKAIEKILK